MTGIAIWKNAKATGMPNFLDAGMSGSHSELDRVTAMASMASAMPTTILSISVAVVMAPIFVLPSYFFPLQVKLARDACRMHGGSILHARIVRDGACYRRNSDIGTAWHKLLSLLSDKLTF